MTIRLSNATGLLCAYKACMRRPRTPEMTFIVRGRYRLEPGEPLALVRSDEISPELVAKTRLQSEEAANNLEDVAISLGQGSITGDVFEDTDEGRVGELIYPSDFADYKLKTDVMLRATCHPPRKDAVDCEVSFQVGKWKKSLRVVGHRVWLDRAADGKHSDPKPIGSVALDYAHAYGGPGFANNPVGKGHVQKLDGDADDFYQPPRSERSAVMPSQQLPNVLHATGKPHRDGLAAGFGPLSPNWPYRSDKLGTRYDQDWIDTRAPYFAEDMDGTYFNAAPPDQQLDGYLRGDEEIVLTNMHPTAKRLTTTLPGKRVRVFVRDVQAQIREIEMRLDTLFIDVDDASLYLTWRGITPVEEEDLTDVEFGLVVSEPLDGRRAPPKPYHEQLERFAADPVGVKDAFPTGFMEFADEAQKLEDADDAELEALLQSDDGDGALTAGLKNLFGPMTPPGLEKVDAGIAKAAEHDDVDGDAINAELGAAVTAAVSEGGSGGVGLRLPLRDGEEPIFPIGTLFRAQERRLVELKKKLPDDAPPEAAQQIDTVLDQIRTNPELLAADPHYEPYAEDDPPPDEPGPGADLLGRDLSGMDLSGRDLSGADIQCAVLHKTNLRGANLAGAKLGGARLSKTELSDANLSDVDLTSASFDGVVAQRTNLTRARLDLFRASRSDFSEAYLSETVGMLATFNESRFERTDFAQARLMLCSYDGCSMGGCRFHEAKLDHVRFDGCDAAGLVLERAELVGASFNRCQLSEAAATGITGQGAVWFETGLQRATFHKADLQASFFFAVDALEADFSRANVPLARFDRAVLRKANFERANLLKATLRKAVVSKTCFRRASLYEAQLTEAAGNDVDVEGADMTGVNVQRSKITLTGRTRS